MVEHFTVVMFMHLEVGLHFFLHECEKFTMLVSPVWLQCTMVSPLPIKIIIMDSEMESNMCISLFIPFRTGFDFWIWKLINNRMKYAYLISLF